MSSLRVPRKARKSVAPVTPDLPRRPQPSDPDGGFVELLQTMRQHWAGVSNTSTPLFHTDNNAMSPSLYDIFLTFLPAELKSHYACRCCRKFVERFGNVVTIDPATGKTKSALWPTAGVPDAFRLAVNEMRDAVHAAAVTGVVVNGDNHLGSLDTPPWSHMSLVWPTSRRYSSPLKTAEAHAAFLKEERGMLVRGLGEFSVDILNKALTLLTSGTLVRPEKGEPLVKWVLQQHVALSKFKDAQRENLLWLTSATAPTGFCHIRSGIVGTLLEDLQASLDVATIAKRWAEKLDPNQYLRAQVAPAAEQLKRAESVIDKMAAAGSLRRRYCRSDDVVETLWAARLPVAPTPSGPVFGHLAIKPAKAPGNPKILDLPETRMTWEKFQRTTLTTATQIEYHVPASTMQLAALVTTCDPASPPILQWDLTEKRNPVSIYSVQASPSSWHLQPGSFVAIDFITSMPYHWGKAKTPNQKEGVLLSLNGCRDSGRLQGGGFLPEFLRSDLREIRSALDAYARSATVEGVAEAGACGLALMKTSDVATPSRTSLQGDGTTVILIFDESGSMSSKVREINAQAEAIRQQLRTDMPQSIVSVLRFGSSLLWERPCVAHALSPIRLGSDRGQTSLHNAITEACRRAIQSNKPTLIYILTDGEATDGHFSEMSQSAIALVMSSGLVTFGCVGPRSASGFFAACGIPQACVRAWDGYDIRDLGIVTQQVAAGINVYAAARASGQTSISNFFTAPVSGFGDGVRLRVTSAGQRQVVILDRWD